jgi:AcrR family transcriptional regulator
MRREHTPMSYIAERRQEERDRRRAEIVDAAEALYAEAGWDGITMDQVARQARLSRALLYVYFRDKGDLHFALVERALEELRRRFEVARAGHATGLAEVEAIGHAYLAFARELPHYFDACARFEAHQFENGDIPANELACMTTGHRVHEVIVESLNRGIADGSIRADLGNPYVTALALWGFSHGMIQIATRKGPQFEREGIPVQSFIEHSLELALRSLRP